jgi:hypothetical protein
LWKLEKLLPLSNLGATLDPSPFHWEWRFQQLILHYHQFWTNFSGRAFRFERSFEADGWWPN